MRGVHPKVERGGLLDMILRFIGRIGSKAQTIADRRRDARCRAAAWPVGTRVQFTGECCTGGKRTGNRVYTVREYVIDADDYRVGLEGSDDWRDMTYGCANGLRRAE